jgi:hypothetical protein
MNNGMEVMWKETVVLQFGELNRYFHAVVEYTHGNFRTADLRAQI